jgi:hypothetical protein
VQKSPAILVDLIQHSVEDALTEAGFQAAIAATGEEVITLLQAIGPRTGLW